MFFTYTHKRLIQPFEGAAWLIFKRKVHTHEEGLTVRIAKLIAIDDVAILCVQPIGDGLHQTELVGAG